MDSNKDMRTEILMSSKRLAAELFFKSGEVVVIAHNGDPVARNIMQRWLMRASERGLAVQVGGSEDPLMVFTVPSDELAIYLDGILAESIIDEIRAPRDKHTMLVVVVFNDGATARTFRLGAS